MIPFEAYTVALELIRSLRAPVGAIARHDPDLFVSLELCESEVRGG